MDIKRFSISERIRSFGFALNGIKIFFATQHNAWLHVIGAFGAITLGFWLRLNASEWCWIVMSIIVVFLAEMFNTAIEFLSDIVSPNFHPQIKMVKDVSAAAVLIAAAGALIIGGIIFLPKISG